MNGEMLLVILSSLAQQESESLSANVKMGLKMKMKRGELIGFHGCLGYDYNPIDKTYKDRLTKKGRLINRPCDYYKILITYLGDLAKEDKERREELVYCSNLNNGG